MKEFHRSSVRCAGKSGVDLGIGSIDLPFLPLMEDKPQREKLDGGAAPLHAANFQRPTSKTRRKGKKGKPIGEILGTWIPKAGLFLLPWFLPWYCDALTESKELPAVLPGDAISRAMSARQALDRAQLCLPFDSAQVGVRGDCTIVETRFLP
jgi:hypothetical protein